MLANLHVKNLALIDEMEIDFHEGLNILTGETGAGKSIILGSVNLALGQKASREMIRKDAPFGLVELTFLIKNKNVIDQLMKKDIFLEDGQLVISRKLMEGRSVSKINGETCTISQVKEVAGLLLDIHGQHEHQSLLYEDKQLEILDEFGAEKTEPETRVVAEKFKEYQKIKKEKENYSLDEAARMKEMSFLQFELDEIEQASLVLGEDQILEETYRKMVNGKKITESLNMVHLITGYEQNDSAGEQISRALRELQAVAAFDEKLAQLEQTLLDMDGIMNDFNREVAEYLSQITFSPEEFAQVEDRLNLLNHLKAKYGNRIEDIFAYQESVSEKFAKLQHYEERKKQTESDFEIAGKNLEDASMILSDIRKEYGKQLEEEVITALQDLNFLDVRFKIDFERAEHFSAKGFDKIRFLISTNPGEDLHMLNKVVSGGELSRIMLALKTILAKKDDTDTLIFDEIDTGISGRTAQLVSEKMSLVSKNHQVLCITHLAQIAAMADHHYEIKKQVENMETHTRIHELTDAEIIQELARIIGGAQITDRVVENAKEMKDLAAVQKNRRVK